jgi:hypothetical protein
MHWHLPGWQSREWHLLVDTAVCMYKSGANGCTGRYRVLTVATPGGLGDALSGHGGGWR